MTAATKKMTGILAIAATILLAAAWVRPAAAEVATSSSYTIQRATLAEGAEASSSGSYVLTPTIGQELVVGTSSSPRFVLQSGFWSFVGSGLVPVVLAVERGSDPDDVDLSWSGNNAPYEVFGSTDCTAVFATSVGTTSANELVGVSAAISGLTCFNVLATAPGPAPSP